MELKLGISWKNNGVKQSWIHRQPGGVRIESLPRYDLQETFQHFIVPVSFFLICCTALRILLFH